jgi:hypothetical protein
LVRLNTVPIHRSTTCQQSTACDLLKTCTPTNNLLVRCQPQVARFKDMTGNGRRPDYIHRHPTTVGCASFEVFDQPSIVRQEAIIHTPPFLGRLESLSFDVLVVHPEGTIHDSHANTSQGTPSAHCLTQRCQCESTSPRISVSQRHRMSFEVLSATLVSPETQDTSEMTEKRIDQTYLCLLREVRGVARR